MRFSYKHCNFSQVCLLIKMALKPVTRSIPNLNHLRLNSEECQFSSDNIHKKLWELIKWSPQGKCLHLWSNFLNKFFNNKCRLCELEVPAQKVLISFRHIHQFLSKHFCLFFELFTGALQFIQVLLLFLFLILKYGNSEKKTI